MDTDRCNATKRETLEFVKAWWSKMAVKAVRTAYANNFVNDASRWPPQHKASTCRAGVDPKTSVCSPDFDCHDIDHLMFTSGAAIPKTFVWSCGPIAVNAAYAWRRMIANHFSRGSSTKGYL
jgi:choline dehydrogenase-like flavoprotein